MYRIIDKRSSGKTSRLMMLAKENNGIIVCGNPHAMKNKANSYGIVGIDFISYNQYLNKDFDLNKDIFIDEIETLMKFLSFNIKGYTLSSED